MSERPKKGGKNPKDIVDQMKTDPLGTLGEIKAKGLSGFLQQGERQGQLYLANSDSLPTKMDDEARSALEKAGVKFPPETHKKQLFQSVQLPEGWKKVPKYEMWTALLDDKERERAHIYYKPQEGNSFLYVLTRLNTHINHGKDGKTTIGEIRDGNNILHRTDEIKDDYKWGEYKASYLLEEWLSQFYPEYKDASAYWDEDIKADPEKKIDIEWPRIKSFSVKVENHAGLAYALKHGRSRGKIDEIRNVLEKFPELQKEHPSIARARKEKPEETVIHLVNYPINPRELDMGKLIEWLRIEGLKPANAEQLLTFHLQYPDYPNADFARLLALKDPSLNERSPQFALGVYYDDYTKELRRFYVNNDEFYEQLELGEDPKKWYIASIATEAHPQKEKSLPNGK